MFSIKVTFRGALYVVDIFEPDPSLEALGTAIAARTGASYDTVKLTGPKLKASIIPATEPCRTVSNTGLTSGSKLLLVASTDLELAALRAQKEDRTVLGFKQELRRAALRRRGPSSLGPAAPPSAEHTFSSYTTLEGPTLRPPPSEALKLLYRLAADPGILGVMAKHRWRVGLLSEMPPEGKVGVSAMCILGYNVNQGQEISLRLRTDDLRGFRKYQRIRETLIHELAHMVHTEHDSNFKALNSQLLRECAEMDWKGAAGGLRLLQEEVGDGTGGELDGWVDDADVMAATQPHSGKTLRELSGTCGAQTTDVRVAAAEAAYCRWQAASASHQQMSSEACDGDGEGEGDVADLPPIANATAPELQHEHQDPSTQAAEVALRHMGAALPQRSTSHRFEGHAGANESPSSCTADSNRGQAQTGASAVPAHPQHGNSRDFMETHVERQSLQEQLWHPPHAAPSTLLDHPSHSVLSSPLAASSLLIAAAAAPSTSPSPYRSTPAASSPARPSGAAAPSFPPAAMSSGAATAAAAPAASSSAAGHQDGRHPMEIDSVDDSQASQPPHSQPAPSASGQEASATPDPLTFLPPDDPVVVKYRQAQAALKLLASSASDGERVVALQTLGTLLRNVLENPGEQRFRRVRMGNAAMYRKAGRLPGAVQLLEAVGFVKEGAGGEEVLQLRRNDPGLLWLVLSAVAVASGHTDPV